MKNMEIYEAMRSVPSEAQKPIIGGRLKNFTDINPMWRLKKLTEQFGACGVGWKYVITSARLEPSVGGEIACFVTIDLYYKNGDTWSEPIPGIGGNMFVAKESSGLRTSDECYKMALTDAISVACKAIGMGADIYYAKDRTKYDTQEQKADEPEVLKPPKETRSKKQQIADIFTGWGFDMQTTKNYLSQYYKTDNMTEKQCDDFLADEVMGVHCKQNVVDWLEYIKELEVKNETL